MGRKRKDLLPEAKECEGQWPLEGLRAADRAVRVYSRAQAYLGSVPSGGWGAAWALLRKDQRAAAAAGESTKKGAALGPLETRAIRVHCRVMDRTFGHLMPGDLQAAVEAKSLHQAMFAVEPGLELASIQGKYMPWKIALFAAWREHSARCPESWSPVLDLAPRAARTAAVLSLAAKNLDGVQYAPWALHCGKKVGFHSGFLPLLIRLGIVITDPSTRKNKQKKYTLPTDGGQCLPLQLSVTPGTVHYLPERWVSRPETLSRISSFLQAADVLAEELRNPPSTCKQWMAAVDAVMRRAGPLHATSFAGTRTYLPLWTIRSYAFASMRVRSSDSPPKFPNSNYCEFSFL